MYKLLYQEINLKKKHHNMIHYATAIRRIGSLEDYCTLRFEGKHTFFKTAQRTSHNYKNVPKTLAKQHQITLANCFINSNLLNKELIIINGKDILACNLNQNLKFIIREQLKIVLSDDDNVNIASDIEYFGKLYKKNNVVARISNNQKYFYSILHIIVHKVIFKKAL